ncbi:hypothetical protein RM704_37665 [Streptomyces sp. DSM 3412]|uniref:Glyoxalase-like domain-containing protein n=1 Tax=Streptomyces gottesmaniae TaxID=3075518 RepID=A0ABU2ZBZ2_9ACTN|nr:hypothetical protein [Streptomyces sp. DSM 3412]MDT0573119.1 hypothetical protein [Streptomyces sp. DSM 3412]
MGNEEASLEYSVWGTIELHPPVPLAQLWGLADQDAFWNKLATTPHEADDLEPPATARQPAWEFVPDEDAGTDDQGRPRTIRYLRVNDQDVTRAEVDRRLRDVARSVGANHAFHGRLRYEGYTDDGEIWLRSGSGSPVWRDTTPRYW